MSEGRKLPPKDNKMGTQPVGKLLFTMALPMIISMLVQALYNIVDSIYVAGISENAVTALGLAFPIQNLLIGFSTGIGVGMNALLSKSLGEKDQHRANLAAGNGILLTVIAMGLFVLFGIFGSEAYFAVQCDDADIMQKGADYTAICCIFSLGLFVEILGEKLLQASGRTIYTLFIQGTGAVINIILDPFLIFGFGGWSGMGIAGAAVATGIGQWVAAVMAVVFNIKCNPDVQFSAKYLKPSADVIKPILTVGIPSIVMMAIGSVMNFGMNQIFLGFENTGKTAAGVFGVYFKLQSFFFMPVFGLNNATIPIVAYNYGARNPKRITATLKRAVLSVMCIMLLGLLVFQTLPELLLAPFQPSDDFLRMGISALRIISSIFPLAAIGIALGASFQALGNGIYSTITSLCRQLIVLLPSAFLLSLSGDVNLVWWAFPIAEVFSLLVTLFFFVRIYRKKVKPMF